MNNDQTSTNDAQCCVDYCKNNFSVSEGEIVNLHKCNQRKLSSSDVWNIQKNKKSVSIRAGL